MKTEDLNTDISTKSYLDQINVLLDTYAPLKRINKDTLKFKSKPWITLGLQKSISVKNKLLTNFINKKDPVLKRNFTLNIKIIEIYFLPLCRKDTIFDTKLIIINILKEIGIILRTHGKESNPLFH